MVLVLIPGGEFTMGDQEGIADDASPLRDVPVRPFFLSAFVVFLWSIETRVKRRRTMDSIHELRSIAHVVDMHQLTKDPAALLDRYRTASSPQRTMTPFELARYLDYCSEMLALISKVAALYVQDFPDHVAATAVDEIENLTTGLSRKIWQKVTLLPRASAD